ncbi:hypothetical protein M951_chr3117 (nucleomorph) [Lotharella oceanica]|uniref:Uncharacterized protein n=1 Tax=Lotharella oceanica TaxID=641309 RepID=A0A060DC01_9EUKA|nr:hypothetical protein M951_chr3117 [Lotharella oceanica]
MQYIKDIVDFNYSNKCIFSFIEFNLVLLYTFGASNNTKNYKFFYNLNNLKKNNIDVIFYNYKFPIVSVYC